MNIKDALAKGRGETVNEVTGVIDAVWGRKQYGEDYMQRISIQDGQNRTIVKLWGQEEILPSDKGKGITLACNDKGKGLVVEEGEYKGKPTKNLKLNDNGKFSLASRGPATPTQEASATTRAAATTAATATAPAADSRMCLRDYLDLQITLHEHLTAKVADPQARAAMVNTALIALARNDIALYGPMVPDARAAVTHLRQIGASHRQISSLLSEYNNASGGKVHTPSELSKESAADFLGLAGGFTCWDDVERFLAKAKS